MKDWIKKIIEKIKGWLCATPAPCLWFGILGMYLTAIVAIPLGDKIADMPPMVPVIALGILVVFINVFCSRKQNLWNALAYLIGAVLMQILCWI